MVRCRLCDKKMNQITYGHLKAAHGITLDEYRARFPKARVVSKKTRNKRIKGTADVWKDPSVRKKRSRAIKNAYRDPELRQSISDTSRERWEDPEYKAEVSAAISRGHSTPERRKANAQQSKDNWANPELAGRMRTSLVARNKSTKKREQTSEQMKARWQDPEWRAKMIEVSRRQWTPEKRKQKSIETTARNNANWQDPAYVERMSQQMTELWQDPEFQALMEPQIDKWTRPEVQVRKWLRKMGYYGSKAGTIRFKAHRWLPTRGAGFAINADFVDRKNKLVIHVDGNHWHDPNKFPEAAARDERNDNWCTSHSWGYVRLSEEDIFDRPKSCRSKVRRLVVSSASSS